MCCSVLQCVAAACCSILQCFAACCNVVQCVAIGCRVSHSDAVRCSSLQRVAECCCVLQLLAVCCSVWQQCAATGEHIDTFDVGSDIISPSNSQKSSQRGFYIVKRRGKMTFEVRTSFVGLFCKRDL